MKVESRGLLASSDIGSGRVQRSALIGGLSFGLSSIGVDCKLQGSGTGA